MHTQMILIELALAFILTWLLASCSLILGGCISACVLSARPRCTQLLISRPQKSDLYIE